MRTMRNHRPRPRRCWASSISRRSSSRSWAGRVPRRASRPIGRRRSTTSDCQAESPQLAGRRRFRSRRRRRRQSPTQRPAPRVHTRGRQASTTRTSSSSSIGSATQSVWYWVKRRGRQGADPRDHLYVKGQPGDLFLGKLGQLVFDRSASSQARETSAWSRSPAGFAAALDVERVTKKFYSEFQEQHLAVPGADRGHRRRPPAPLVRLGAAQPADVHLLPPEEGFLDGGNLDYLQAKLDESRASGQGPLLSATSSSSSSSRASPSRRHDAIAGSADAARQRSAISTAASSCRTRSSRRTPSIDIPDAAFENLFDLFERYSWHLDDTPGGDDDEINPDVLGYIFEKYINQKAFGAYYTRPEITSISASRPSTG